MLGTIGRVAGCFVVVCLLVAFTTYLKRLGRTPVPLEMPGAVVEVECAGCGGLVNWGVKDPGFMAGKYECPRCGARWQVEEWVEGDSQ